MNVRLTDTALRVETDGDSYSVVGGLTSLSTAVLRGVSRAERIREADGEADGVG